MNRIVFHTNLDEAKPDVADRNGSEWPSRVPCKGERVRFPFTRDRERFWFDLEVVDVVWTPDSALVELHMPSWQRISIQEWTDWFNRHRYGRETPR